MKVTVEVDCTPVEARTFLGLPDVTGLNDALVTEMPDVAADFLADVLPGYLVEQFGPQRNVSARIDSVTYGPPGSSGGSNDRAFDTIEGVGRVDGREFPIQTSIQTAVTLPDVGGYAARVRQDQLARSFAQWLAQEPGSWR